MMWVVLHCTKAAGCELGTETGRATCLLSYFLLNCNVNYLEELDRTHAKTPVRKCNCYLSMGV